MGYDFVGGVAVVEYGLKNLHAFPGDFRAAQSPDEFLTFA
jgi:hypothetical protein